MTEHDEHEVEIEEAIGGFEATCRCGWKGKVRSKRADAEYDAFIHPHTGGGARSLDEILAEEEERVGGRLKRLQARVRQLMVNDADNRRN